jgi:hypothetical protein
VLLLAHPAKLEGAYDLACDGWLAGWMSVHLRALCLQRAFQYPSKGFKFPYPSKGFFTLSFKGGFPLILQREKKTAILTLLAFSYPSKGFFTISFKGSFPLILQREKKVQF